jgi:hypothetical protein
VDFCPGKGSRKLARDAHVAKRNAQSLVEWQLGIRAPAGARGRSIPPLTWCFIITVLQHEGAYGNTDGISKVFCQRPSCFKPSSYRSCCAHSSQDSSVVLQVCAQLQIFWCCASRKMTSSWTKPLSTNGAPTEIARYLGLTVKCGIPFCLHSGAKAL